MQWPLYECQCDANASNAMFSALFSMSCCHLDAGVQLFNGWITLVLVMLCHVDWKNINKIRWNPTNLALMLFNPLRHSTKQVVCFCSHAAFVKILISSALEVEVLGRTIDWCLLGSLGISLHLCSQLRHGGTHLAIWCRPDPPKNGKWVSQLEVKVGVVEDDCREVMEVP